MPIWYIKSCKYVNMVLLFKKRCQKSVKIIGIVCIASIGYRKKIAGKYQDFLDYWYRIVSIMQYNTNSSTYLRSFDIGSKCCEYFKTIQSKSGFMLYINFILQFIRFVVFTLFFHARPKYYSNWIQMLFQWISTLHSKNLVISI